MTKDEAAKLALNGYSKADIEALGFSFTESDENDNGGADNNDNGGADNNDKGGNDNGGDSGNNSNNESSKALEELTKTVSELSATVKAIQEANLKGARGGKDGNNAQSASDVVKNFIKNM